MSFFVDGNAGGFKEWHETTQQPAMRPEAKCIFGEHNVEDDKDIKP